MSNVRVSLLMANVPVSDHMSDARSTTQMPPLIGVQPQHYEHTDPSSQLGMLSAWSTHLVYQDELLTRNSITPLTTVTGTGLFSLHISTYEVSKMRANVCAHLMMVQIVEALAHVSEVLPCQVFRQGLEVVPAPNRASLHVLDDHVQLVVHGVVNDLSREQLVCLLET
jgi:hypothetical protein